MRCILKVAFPVEIGNAAIKSGKLQKTVKAFVDEWKPEAVYFTAEHGKRGAMFVVDLKESSQIPALAEPFFLALNASVDLLPAMTLEDLMKAGPDIESAAKKYA
jgi:hypothetical protein